MLIVSRARFSANTNLNDKMKGKEYLFTLGIKVSENQESVFTVGG